MDQRAEQLKQDEIAEEKRKVKTKTLKNIIKLMHKTQKKTYNSKENHTKKPFLLL